MIFDVGLDSVFPSHPDFTLIVKCRSGVVCLLKQMVQWPGTSTATWTDHLSLNASTDSVRNRRPGYAVYTEAYRDHLHKPSSKTTVLLTVGPGKARMIGMSMQVGLAASTIHIVKHCKFTQYK